MRYFGNPAYFLRFFGKTEIRALYERFRDRFLGNGARTGPEFYAKGAWGDAVPEVCFWGKLVGSQDTGRGGLSLRHVSHYFVKKNFRVFPNVKNKRIDW